VQAASTAAVSALQQLLLLLLLLQQHSHVAPAFGTAHRIGYRIWLPGLYAKWR
jgi:hypothetical protein